MRTRTFAFLFATLLPSAASAEAPSYSYFDVNYQANAEMDVCALFAPPCTIDMDGFGIKASFAINDSWYIAFDYITLGSDPSAFDVNDWALTAGWHDGMLYAEFGMENSEFDACAALLPPCAFDDSGYVVELGLRTMATERLELSAHVGRSDTGDFGTSTNLGFGAVWMFSEGIGVSFNYDMRKVADFATATGFDIDIDTMGVGLRLDFD